MKALFDSDVLIDFLVGVPEADVELRRYSERLISVVSWTEVMIGVSSADEEIRCRDFLASFSVISFDLAIAEEAARIRRGSRIKLPDAIIWASAQKNGALLVTRNTRDFPSDDPFVRIPYQV